MTAITVTNTFTDATSAVASEVNTNFTDLVNGLGDTTKDVSISALTTAGDVTFNGQLASTIPIKTDATFDVGSATLGLRSVFFGGNSQRVDIKASGSASATWTLTLPVDAGTSGQFLQTNGSGVASWAGAEFSSYTIDTSASATGETLTSASEIVKMYNPTSGNITVKLDNSFAAGAFLKILNTGTDNIEIDANDDSLIRTIYPDTAAEIVCISGTPADSGDWENQTKITSNWLAYNPACTMTTNAATTGHWKRDGDEIWIKTVTLFTGSTDGVNYRITLPFSLTVDTDKISTQVGQINHVGELGYHHSGTGYVVGHYGYYSTTQTNGYWHDASAATVRVGGITNTSPSTIGSGYKIVGIFKVPVSEWTEFTG